MARVSPVDEGGGVAKSVERAQDDYYYFVAITLYYAEEAFSCIGSPAGFESS